MAESSEYPFPTFYFEVALGEITLMCSEISAAALSYEQFDSRDGKSKDFFSLKNTGLSAADNITIKNAVFKSVKDFKTWHDKVATRNTEGYTTTLTIIMLNEDGTPAYYSYLYNVWVTKWQMPDMNSMESRPAIESITLVMG